MTPKPPTATPTSDICTKSVDQLAAAWLASRKRKIDATYAAKGMEGSTVLTLVSVDGAPPRFTVTYTRSDTVAGTEQSPVRKTEPVTCSGCNCQ